MVLCGRGLQRGRGLKIFTCSLCTIIFVFAPPLVNPGSVPVECMWSIGVPVTAHIHACIDVLYQYSSILGLCTYMYIQCHYAGCSMTTTWLHSPLGYSPSKQISPLCKWFYCWTSALPSIHKAYLSALQAYGIDYSLMQEWGVAKALMLPQTPPKLCPPSCLEFCSGRTCYVCCHCCL